MLNSIKQFWNFISHLGIAEREDNQYSEEKRRVFFNKSLIFGFIAMIGTIGSSIAFIGNYAFLNLIGATGIIVAFIIHYKGNFAVAKRVAIYPILILGIILTGLCGPDFLYHTGVITVVAFAWIVFDPKKELPELLIFVAVTFYVYIIAEFNFFDAPDFSNHPDTASSRIANLIMYTGLTLIFINFTRKLNNSYEERLSKTIIEREQLLEEVLLKTKQLEKERNTLEEVISERTAELIQQKEILEEKNSEQEILLKEIHHRVKNNLQIIVSLLNMQASKFDDPTVLRAIDETQNRIITMSLVHQRMYKTADFVAVEMKDYIDQLIENNLELFVPLQNNFKYENNTTSDLKIDIETAIPLGLVINEMISNSFKHAFNDSSESHAIIVALENPDNHEFKLKYKDNGLGFPEGMNIEESPSLGLQLICSLVDQINGELKYYNEDGAAFEVTFSILKDPKTI